MNLNEILSNSFRYPLSNVKRMLLLGLLLATSILIIPTIFAYGYFLRIMKCSFNGSNELPPFEEWGEMFVDGLRYILVTIVYIGIPAVIAAIISIIILVTQYPQLMRVNDFLVVLGIVSVIILAIPYIFSLIALPNMVYNKKEVSKAFDFKHILGIIKSISWSKYISAVIVIVILDVLLSGFSFYFQSLHLGLTTYLISGIISLFIGSYLLAFRGRLLAVLYHDGTEKVE
ncbi:MAG: DUF4013 domain-containing protein [Methanobacterium sp.]